MISPPLLSITLKTIGMLVSVVIPEKIMETDNFGAIELSKNIHDKQPVIW
jgi:hypothetical protein